MIRMMPVLLVAVALLLGCAGASATDAPATAAAVVAPSAAVADAATAVATPAAADASTVVVAAAALGGAAAPDFSFTLFHGEGELGGGTLSLAELRGRPVVLNFWARLCTPCWSEMPELQDFYEERGGQVQLLGIDVGQFTGLGSHKDAGRLLDSLGITYPAGYTDDADVVPGYGIRAMPTTVFITAEGRIHRHWSGSINREQLEGIVAELLEGD